MLNRSASLTMSTSALKALPGKLDIKIFSPSILCILTSKAHMPLLVHTPVSQGARFLKIDLAKLSSQKRFDFRNS